MGLYNITMEMNTTLGYGDHPWYNRMGNTFYYMILIPIGFLGNLLTVLVVLYIVKHQRSRRSIPDVLLGVLATTDLFSIFCVHIISLIAMVLRQWPFPHGLCIFQAFSASVYFKLEFLLQVAISMDRYLALVRPFKHHTFSSLKVAKICIIIFILSSVISSGVLVIPDLNNSQLLTTWYLCSYYWTFDSILDTVVTVITTILFTVGIGIFIYCNANLFRILWQYHAKKTQMFLKELSDAMNAMEKGPKTNKDFGNGTFTKSKSPEPHMTPNTLKEIQMLPPAYTEIISKTIDIKPPLKGNERTDFQMIHHKENLLHGNDQTSEKVKGIKTTNTSTHSNSLQAEMKSKYNQNIPYRNEILTDDRLQYSQSIDAHHVGSNSLAQYDTEQEKAPIMVTNTGQRKERIKVDNEHIVEKVHRKKSGNELRNSEKECNSGDLDLEKSQSFTDLFGPESSTFHDTSTKITTLPVSSQDNTTNVSNSSIEISDNCHNRKKQNSDVKETKGKSCIYHRATSVHFENETDETDIKSPVHNTTHGDNNPEHLAHEALPLLTVEEPTSIGDSECSVNSEEALLKTAKTFDNQIIESSANNASIEDGDIRENHKNDRNNMKAKKTMSLPLGKDVGAICQARSNCTNVISPDRAKPPASFNRMISKESAAKSLKTNTSSSTYQFQMNYVQKQIKKLMKKMQKKAQRQKKEILLARLVLVCATLFVVTWIPYGVVLFFQFCRSQVPPVVADLALKLIFANAIFNPIFYGLCRKNYRKGYSYVIHTFFHYLCCGAIGKPGEDKIFFESRQRKMKRQLDAAQMDFRLSKQRKRRMSVQALQIIQHTINLRPASPLENGPSPRLSPSTTDFQPSKRLQELFDHCMESDSDSSESSSIDYDALVFDMSEEKDLYENLKQVWSVCVNGTDIFEEDEDEDGDIELDVDYDALLGKDFGSDEVFHHGNQTFMAKDSFEFDYSANLRLAMSTPAAIMRDEFEDMKAHTTSI